MYNFLDSQLKPNVSTKSPVTDGYEVSNLISDNNKLLSKGFLAYSAIKPPIDIDFELICSVNLHYIIVWATVGSQKTSGIEILARNSFFDYVTICKVYFDEPGIVIYNRKFYFEQNKSDIPATFSTHFFRSQQFKIISCIENFRIRIIRTVSSVPCVGKIQVWGKVSNTCSSITKQTITCLVNKKSNEYPNEITCKPSSSVRSNPFENNLNIPEEFIDPISCDVMSLPMTLPCGKTVDQSTLDKHKESEANWGRAPSDPFTGQQFNSNRRPVLNSALKSRIDEFLFQNAHRKEVENVPRTSGRLNECKRTHTCTNQEEISNENCNKRQKTNELQVEENSSRDLNSIIQNAFKKYNIVRYSTATITEAKNTCGICNNQNNLYILLCNHFICRECLIKSTVEYRCKICNKLFLKSEVKKFHEV